MTRCAERASAASARRCISGGCRASWRGEAESPTTPYRPKERTDVDRSKMPLHAHGWWRHVEPRLVAQSAEAQDPGPALAPVRSHGQGLQLRQGVQEPRPGGGEEGCDDRHD